MADAGLGSDGVVIGRDGLRRTFCYDPFVLYQKGLLNGPNMLVLGDIGYGKSALTKSFLYRQVGFGYTPLVTDVKGEYDRLCEALQVNPIRFVSGGSLRLNPLDPKIGGAARLTLLRSIAELLLGRQLYPREGAALEQAYVEVEQAAHRRHRQPRIPEVVGQLLRPSPTAPAPWRLGSRTCRSGAATSASRCAAWSPAISPACSTRRPAPAWTWTARWSRSTSARSATPPSPSSWPVSAPGCGGLGPRRRAPADRGPGGAWHLLKSPAFAEMQQENFKLARQYGVQNIIVMHHLGDLKAAGDAGSRTAELAQNLLADAATRVLYHLDEGELHATAELLGLNRAHCRIIPKLYRASGLWLVGGRAFVVHHRLAPAPSPERWIVDTDGAMLGLGADRRRA